MTFLNKKFFPSAIRVLRSTMLLEFSRDYIELLNEDTIHSHPHIRCSCGSNKVFNYGMPKNNGTYFFCRTCETSFKVQAGNCPDKQG